MSFPGRRHAHDRADRERGPAELDRFCDAMIAIRKEIDEVAAGTWPKDDNPLRGAPHTADSSSATGTTPTPARRRPFPAGSVWEKERGASSAAGPPHRTGRTATATWSARAPHRRPTSSSGQAVWLRSGSEQRAKPALARCGATTRPSGRISPCRRTARRRCTAGSSPARGGWRRPGRPSWSGDVAAAEGAVGAGCLAHRRAPVGEGSGVRTAVERGRPGRHVFVVDCSRRGPRTLNV
jgi:glycine dehydrogenase